MNEAQITIKRNHDIHITSATSNVYVNGKLVYTALPVDMPKKLSDFIIRNVRRTISSDEEGLSYTDYKCHYSGEDLNIRIFRGEKDNKDLIDIDFKTIISPFYYEGKQGRDMGYQTISEQWNNMVNLMIRKNFSLEALDDENVCVRMDWDKFDEPIIDEIITMMQKYRGQQKMVFK